MILNSNTIGSRRIVPEIIERAESLLSDRPHRQPLFGEINLFKGIAFLLQGDGARSFKHIEDALEQIPATLPYTKGVAESFWGLAGQMQGQKDRVVAALTDLLRNHTLSDVRKIREMAALVSVDQHICVQEVLPQEHLMHLF